MQGSTSIGGSGAFTNHGAIRFEMGPGTDYGTLSVSLDNSGSVEVAGGTLEISGPIDQVAGGTLTGETWIADFDLVILDLASAPGLTTIGPDAFVSTSGGKFPQIADLSLVQGTFRVSEGG
jgi:hypothetical protein